jgi:hypothetical protein
MSLKGAERVVAAGERSGKVYGLSHPMRFRREREALLARTRTGEEKIRHIASRFFIKRLINTISGRRGRRGSGPKADVRSAMPPTSAFDQAHSEERAIELNHGFASDLRGGLGELLESQVTLTWRAVLVCGGQRAPKFISAQIGAVGGHPRLLAP